MQPSMELRWFIQGGLTEDLNGWFDTSALVSHAEEKFKPSIEERQDTYLSLVHRTELGIKLRKGERIEIKERLHDRGIQAFSAEVQGRVEQWVKWSFMLGAEDRNPPNISLPVDAWTDVQKKRKSRKFAVYPANYVVEVEPNGNPENVPEGCNLEVTELLVRNQVWHSLGFEAFGSIGTVEGNLLLVVKEVLLHSRFPAMKAGDSFGYPVWLSRVLRT
jgi:hypothetical protein